MLRTWRSLEAVRVTRLGDLVLVLRPSSSIYHGDRLEILFDDQGDQAVRGIDFDVPFRRDGRACTLVGDF